MQTHVNYVNSESSHNLTDVKKKFKNCDDITAKRHRHCVLTLLLYMTITRQQPVGNQLRQVLCCKETLQMSYAHWSRRRSTAMCKQPVC